MDVTILFPCFTADARLRCQMPCWDPDRLCSPCAISGTLETPGTPFRRCIAHDA